jgi:hypothetical protein
MLEFLALVIIIVTMGLCQFYIEIKNHEQLMKLMRQQQKEEERE